MKATYTNLKFIYVEGSEKSVGVNLKLLLPHRQVQFHQLLGTTLATNSAPNSCLPNVKLSGLGIGT